VYVLSLGTCVSVTHAIIQDIAEAIAQLALAAPGREALLRDAAMTEALQELCEHGWTKEAQDSAQSALVAISQSFSSDAGGGGTPGSSGGGGGGGLIDAGQEKDQAADDADDDHDDDAAALMSSQRLQQRHCMISYQWNFQSVVKRIVKGLQERGYRTWFE
jgi:hypothetical protein